MFFRGSGVSFPWTLQYTKVDDNKKVANFNWVYHNDAGNRYVVGVFHGENTGHLMVYCDLRIVLIDFNVLQSANYSFFIEDELCEMIITRKADRFEYDFRINREVDTPQNRLWRARARSNKIKAWLLVGSFVAILGLVVGWLLYRQYHPVDKLDELLSGPKAEEAVGRVFIDSRRADSLIIRYTFVANSMAFEEKGRQSALALSNGMPLEAGDEFVVRYAGAQPFVNRIYFDRPTVEQVQRYRDRAVKKHIGLHSDITEERARCLIEIAYDLKGLSGLADFYFQDASPQQNPRHNELTYKRLVRDEPFRQKVEGRCL